jgi:hypothetical protein
LPIGVNILVLCMKHQDEESLGVHDTPRKRLQRFATEALREKIASMSDDEVERFGALLRPRDIKVVITLSEGRDG